MINTSATNKQVLLTSSGVKSVVPLLAVATVFATFALAGPRSALLLLIGMGFGLVLEGLRFGFAGPWRQMLVERDCRGLIAQFLAIALCAAMAFPLLESASTELSAAHAPVGLAMIVAAFVFGATMQIVLACGSGVLVNAGSGNIIALLALPGFIAGSFLGTLHLEWWTSIGSLPVYSMQNLLGAGTGLWVTLAGLLLLGVAAATRALPGKRLPGSRLWWAAALVAALAVLNLIISGQSWGIVYGLGLWGAKAAQAGGMDVAASGFWSSASNAERLTQSIFTDVTSLTNIGIMAGALAVMHWRRADSKGGSTDPQTSLPTTGLWVLMILGGLVLGYSSRLAFGCNVGAYFSGIATGSLHGWIWFVAAFAGAILGIRLRQRFFATADKTPVKLTPPGRLRTSAGAVLLVLVLLLLDYQLADPINPFAAPPPAAYGSGLAPTGAHCTQFN